MALLDYMTFEEAKTQLSVIRQSIVYWEQWVTDNEDGDGFAFRLTQRLKQEESRLVKEIQESYESPSTAPAK